MTPPLQGLLYCFDVSFEPDCLDETAFLTSAMNSMLNVRW